MNVQLIAYKYSTWLIEYKYTTSLIECEYTTSLIKCEYTTDCGFGLGLLGFGAYQPL